jgi:hypothetical protein
VAGIVTKMLHAYFFFFSPDFRGSYLLPRSAQGHQNNIIQNITMKKTILTLALVAGLTSFAGIAKADIIFQTINQTYETSGNLSFVYQPSVPQIHVSTSQNLSSGYSFSYNPSGPNFMYQYYGIGSPTSPAYWSMTSDQQSQTLAADIVGGNRLSSGDDVSSLLQSRGATAIVRELTSGYYGLQNVSYQNYRVNGAYYGWSYITVNDSSITLNAVAFQSTPFQSITVGDTGSGIYTPPTVPEPSTYALLGIGAMGLLLVLRKKKTA